MSTSNRRRFDNLTPEQRRRTMQAVRSTDTGPEHLVSEGLRSLRVTFRGYPPLPGSPDFLLPDLRTVIFVHGCFWHGHGCRKISPKTHRAYWREKILRNQRRDQRVRRALNRLGWTVITIWECQIARGLETASISRAVGRAQRIDSVACRRLRRQEADARSDRVVSAGRSSFLASNQRR